MLFRQNIRKRETVIPLEQSDEESQNQRFAPADDKGAKNSTVSHRLHFSAFLYKFAL